MISPHWFLLHLETDTAVLALWTMFWNLAPPCFEMAHSFKFFTCYKVCWIFSFWCLTNLNDRFCHSNFRFRNARGMDLRHWIQSAGLAIVPLFSISPFKNILTFHDFFLLCFPFSFIVQLDFRWPATAFQVETWWMFWFTPLMGEVILEAYVLSLLP